MGTYWDKDFYSVEEIDGRKYVHIFGYFYDNGGRPEWPSAVILEYAGLMVELPAFLKLSHFDYDVLTGDAKQYSQSVTRSEAEEAMITYFDGNPPEELSYNDLTLDTPCGNYVDDGRRFAYPSG